MNTDTGHWNGHFYVPTEKGFITACGIKGGYVALDPEEGRHHRVRGVSSDAHVHGRLA
jgi:hypothetical protein